MILVPVRPKYDRCRRSPSVNSSCDPVVFEEVQPEAHGTIDDIDEKDRLTVEQLYFKTRNVKGAAESVAEGTPVMMGLLDLDMSDIPSDLTVF